MTERVKVLHVLPDLGTGGGQVLLLNLLREMDGNRYSHIVCGVEGAGGMGGQFEALGAEVVTLGAKRIRHRFHAITRLHALACSRDVHVVHSNNTNADLRPAIVTSRLRRLPLVTSLHGYRRPRWPLRRRIYNGLIWGVARPQLFAVLAVSEPVRNAWREHFTHLGLTEDRIQTILPVINVSAYATPERSQARREICAAFDLQSDDRVFVCVSRLVEGKGLERLLGAFARLAPTEPHAKLVIIGDGPLRDRLNARVRDLAIASQVRMAGERSDVPRLLAGADIFVFASEAESFGLAPCEAMAAGLPIVMARLPSLDPIVIHGTTALVAPQGDTDMLARHMTTLCGDPALSGKMGRAAAVRAAEIFRPGQTASVLSSIYDAAAGRPSEVPSTPTIFS